jgi:hypothetical protein
MSLPDMNPASKPSANSGRTQLPWRNKDDPETLELKKMLVSQVTVNAKTSSKLFVAMSKYAQTKHSKESFLILVTKHLHSSI